MFPICSFFPLSGFMMFCFFLVFRNWTVWCLSLFFFVMIITGIWWAAWICTFVSPPPSLRNIRLLPLPLFLFFCLVFSLLSLPYILYCFIILKYIFILLSSYWNKMKLEVDRLPLSLVSSQLTMLASLTSPRYLGSAVSVHSSLSTISLRVRDFF